MDEYVKTSDQVKIFLNIHCNALIWVEETLKLKSFILFESEDKMEPLISPAWWWYMIRLTSFMTYFHDNSNKVLLKVSHNLSSPCQYKLS